MRLRQFLYERVVADGDCHFAEVSRGLYCTEQDVTEYLLVELPVCTDPSWDGIGLDHCDLRHALMRESMKNAQEVGDELAHRSILLFEMNIKFIIKDLGV